MLNFSLFIYFDFLEGILEIRTRYFLCAKFGFKFTFSDLPKFYCVSTAQKMKFSITDFFSKCNQIRRKLQIWSHLQKKSLMENFIFVQWKFFWFVLRNVKTPLIYSGLRLLFDAWSKVKSNFLETKPLRSIQTLWSTNAGQAI